MTRSHLVSAGILSVIVLIHATVSAASQGGNLIFRGEILNAPCQMRVADRLLISTCSPTLLSQQDILSVTQAGNRVYTSRAGALSFAWSSRSKNAGVLTVAVP